MAPSSTAIFAFGRIRLSFYYVFLFLGLFLRCSLPPSVLLGVPSFVHARKGCEIKVAILHHMILLQVFFLPSLLAAVVVFVLASL